MILNEMASARMILNHYAFLRDRPILQAIIRSNNVDGFLSG